MLVACCFNFSRNGSRIGCFPIREFFIRVVEMIFQSLKKNWLQSLFVFLLVSLLGGGGLYVMNTFSQKKLTFRLAGEWVGVPDSAEGVALRRQALILKVKQQQFGSRAKLDKELPESMNEGRAAETEKSSTKSSTKSSVKTLAPVVASGEVESVQKTVQKILSAKIPFDLEKVEFKIHLKLSPDQTVEMALEEEEEKYSQEAKKTVGTWKVVKEVRDRGVLEITVLKKQSGTKNPGTKNPGTKNPGAKDLVVTKSPGTEIRRFRIEFEETKDEKNNRSFILSEVGADPYFGTVYFKKIVQE